MATYDSMENCVGNRNILLIVSGPVIGGHESQAYEIAADLLGMGHSMTIICSAQSTADYFGKMGCEVKVVNFTMPGKIWKQWMNSSAIGATLAGHIVGYDSILISAGTIEGVIPVSHAIKNKVGACEVIGYVPMYIDRSLTHGIVGKIYNCLLNTLGRAVDRYLTINKIQAAIIRKNLGRPTVFVANRIRPVTAPVQSYGKRLVYVGRFDDQQKGLLDLLEKLDSPQNPYGELIMIGDGPDREQIHAKAGLLKSLKVQFPGWLSGASLENFLGSNDVLIMNSRWEGEPLVVKEFAARGLMSISREITGVRGLITKKFRFESDLELHALLAKTYDNKVSVADNYSNRVEKSGRQQLLGKIFS